MNQVDLPPNLPYYLANQSLEVSEGTFYDKWSFVWLGERVVATISNFDELITLLTDHAEEDKLSIVEWMKKKKEELDETQEGGD